MKSADHNAVRINESSHIHLPRHLLLELEADIIGSSLQRERKHI